VPSPTAQSSERQTEGRTQLRVGEVVEVTIERIVPGGYGLAHVAERALFVALSAPGDRLRVRIDRVRGAVGFATPLAVIAPSASRVEPPCPLFGRCGGCDFQHLAYAAQLEAKREIVADALRRIGGVTLETPIDVVPSPRPWGYRAVAEWQADPATSALGYYARESRTVVDVPACPILEPALDARLAEIRAGQGNLRRPGRSEIRAAAGDGATDDVRSPGGPQRELTRTIAGERYRFDVACFFQANPAILASLVDEVLRPVVAGEVDRSGIAVDLYCGIGLFTLPLARRLARVIGVESDRRAVRFARRNLRDAGLTGARIEPQAVERWLTTYQGIERVAYLVLDPPRVGAKDAIGGIVRLEPARLTYVSCDPATLARDLRSLLVGGYELTRVAAFDMFPQTHHVEVVAHLTKAAT
jgi:23S rRNA (uracil1939-C5)-methyltransferase